MKLWFGLALAYLVIHSALVCKCLSQPFDCASADAGNLGVEAVGGSSDVSAGPVPFACCFMAPWQELTRTVAVVRVLNTSL